MPVINLECSKRNYVSVAGNIRAQARTIVLDRALRFGHGWGRRMDKHHDAVGAEQPTGPVTQRNWRVWFVIALWVILVLQGGVDILARTTGSNAFPTIAMPGFGAKNIGADGGARVTDRRIDVIDADGTLHKVTPEGLLAPMPTASAVFTLNRIFDPTADVAPELSAETIEYLKRQSEQLGLDGDPVGLRLVWQPEIFDIRTLQRTPAGEATVREVDW